MNVNGARFHLMLGGTKDAGDWDACLTPQRVPLSKTWDDADATLPFYDQRSGHLTLLPLVEPIPDTPGEPRFTAADARAAAADRNGNLYVVADDRRGLLVRSAGDGRTTRFWPPAPPRQPIVPPAFADAVPETPATETLAGLAIVAGDFLVVGFGGDEGAGLLRFDLVGGGPPERLMLPDDIVPAALASACDCDGGLWLLDAASRRLFKLDRDLRLESRPVADAPPVFAPDGEAPAESIRHEPVTIDASAATARVALATLADGSVILLDAPTETSAGLFIVDPGASLLRPLIRLDFIASCFTATTAAAITTPTATTGSDAPIVLLADAGGNQARLVALDKNNTGWRATERPGTLPLRRFGGRALVEIKGKAYYDSGAIDPRWVPVVEVSHRRFAASATFLTPVLDGAEPQCIWDRIRLDACIPSGARVRIEARAADQRATLDAASVGGWIEQPALVLSPGGPELPGKRAIAAIATDTISGRGTWDVLLQNIVGRYAQLRVTLTGNERVTPALRAMRAWYPRFSYVQRFLPGIYREEATSASFLERFLANFEGINTAIEDRIATAETLFDPRIAPAELLAWLAGWYDVALDPAWDERRRRLFIAHAARFFGWRGTIRGLGLALKLALDTTTDARDFDLDTPACPSPRAIRIVESHASRVRGRTFPPAAPSAPGIRSLDGDWLPEEGAAGLWARWPALPTPAGRFPLFARAGDEADWTALVQRQFGFVPMLGQGERARWQAYQVAIGVAAPTDDLPSTATDAWRRYAALSTQDRSAWHEFLRARYRTIAALQAAHDIGWDDIALVPLPDYLAASATAARDWLAFEGQYLPIGRAAHRFSVLLPRLSVDADPAEEDRRLALARRIVGLEKPAHTVFDVRFYWAMNRIGEARLGLDSAIGQGSRAPELIPGAVLGRAYVGAAFVGGRTIHRAAGSGPAC